MFCPLDCWDSCKLKVKSEKLKVKFEGDSITPYLCWKLNNYFKFPSETTPKYNSKNIMLNETLDKLADILKNKGPKRVLFVKGSGNMGIMQNVTKLFFENYGATFAVGSTCDGLGEEGIIKGRGKSLILPTWIIKNAKNIIIWGRNPYVTNIHLIPMIKDKFTVTIDAIETKTAKNSDLFIQVKPNSDFYLAILLAQMVIESEQYEVSDNFDEYKKIVFSYDKKDLMKKCGINNEELMKLFEIIKQGGAVLTGLGTAKCKECWKTTWAIDSLFYMLGYFGKKDRGVAFLGSSGYGINNPFSMNHKNKVPLWDVNLDDYEVVFVQAGNPLVSFPNRHEWQKLKNKTTVVFGKYMDETAQIATLFIPSKDFFEKKDVRGSYFHEYVITNEKCKVKNEKCISEYELTKFLMNEFGFTGLKSEDEYIEEILNADLEKTGDEIYRKRVFDKPPYSDGFFTDNGKFKFLNEDFEYNKKPFEIVTAKHDKALNSQFQRDEIIYINPNSKNIMLRWVTENIPEKRVVFTENIPENIIYAKGGSVINEFINCKGENAYYEIH
ncbi:molybdopterin oxidoreductase [Nautilia profundicola AmH]|uniref:Molybdopterin oxidoreductase n=1 Tax=Nautilia profundicola (strain ATCC BAA-1463 / DSM 18972 / AmH) TaxID=598659 RepID=B9L9L6_NAUPA|nr:molybdopterin-dependent oxidoreductase [Nautilia profundicola]ACM93577.1 molybdopterin oxidoreductase [Nautilia profundicola AmH]